AMSCDLKVEIDVDGDRLDSFLGLYYRTMDRLLANKKYYFNKSYFQAINEKLKGNFAYFYVTHKGIDIATKLVLVSDDKIYYFLGGSHEGYFRMRANEFLHYEIIKWGTRNGKKTYVLGGGYQLNDSLFLFKKGFAPDGNMPFKVGTKIYDQDVYNQLVKQNEARNMSGAVSQADSEFFPRYRSGDNDYLI
ncbi:MAG: GNAT family N-acetyltransferase, partial [Marinilabiliaceae bacterium]|nr:GNAT family N-acetyltransferase [Marinilabiliaceae bacterium]